MSRGWPAGSAEPLTRFMVAGDHGTLGSAPASLDSLTSPVARRPPPQGSRQLRHYLRQLRQWRKKKGRSVAVDIWTPQPLFARVGTMQPRAEP
jgi:hypothetical protein